jgi:hypothetical protein
MAQLLPVLGAVAGAAGKAGAVAAKVGATAAGAAGKAALAAGKAGLTGAKALGQGAMSAGKSALSGIKSAGSGLSKMSGSNILGGNPTSAGSAASNASQGASKFAGIKEKLMKYLGKTNFMQGKSGQQQQQPASSIVDYGSESQFTPFQTNFAQNQPSFGKLISDMLAQRGR